MIVSLDDSSYFGDKTGQASNFLLIKWPRWQECLGNGLWALCNEAQMEMVLLQWCITQWGSVNSCLVTQGHRGSRITGEVLFPPYSTHAELTEKRLTKPRSSSAVSQRCLQTLLCDLKAAQASQTGRSQDHGGHLGFGGLPWWDSEQQNPLGTQPVLIPNANTSVASRYWWFSPWSFPSSIFIQAQRDTRSAQSKDHFHGRASAPCWLLQCFSVPLGSCRLWTGTVPGYCLHPYSSSSSPSQMFVEASSLDWVQLEHPGSLGRRAWSI